MNDMTEKIAFVGVGRMGANMARRLHEIGYAVTAVYDVNSASAEALAQEIGSTAGTSLAAVTAATALLQLDQGLPGCALKRAP